jgi:hypothetical protein
MAMTPRDGDSPYASPQPRPAPSGTSAGASASSSQQQWHHQPQQQHHHDPQQQPQPVPLWRLGSSPSLSSFPPVASLAAGAGGPGGLAGHMPAHLPISPTPFAAAPEGEPRTPVGSPMRGGPSGSGGQQQQQQQQQYGGGGGGGGGGMGSPTRFFSPRSQGRGSVQYSDRFIPSRAAHARLDFSPLDRELATAEVNRSAAEREVSARVMVGGWRARRSGAGAGALVLGGVFLLCVCLSG